MLDVQNLSINYVNDRKVAKAVHNVSFQLHEGELLGLVGESGCGKTTLVMSLMRLLPAAGEIANGHIYFRRHDLATLSEEEMNDIRWDGISIIFQGAMNALNPVRTVNDQIAEAILKHMPGTPPGVVNARRVVVDQNNRGLLPEVLAPVEGIVDSLEPHHSGERFARHDAAIAGILGELDGPADSPRVRNEAPGRPGPHSARDEVGVSLTDVAYTYPGADAPVLVGLSKDAGPGLTAVTGPSGVGKSTLLELAAGLRTPTAGTVRAGRAHLVTQRPFLPAGTLRDALVLGNGASDQTVWDALRLVGLEGFVASLPQALATPLGDDGFGLSAGQRARIALARATLSTAPVLLVDEPTAHLDADAADLVHGVLADLGERRTVVVVTHRPELVALADRHVVLTREGAEVVA